MRPGYSLIFIDVETTGLFPLRGDRIVEIGAVRVEDGMIMEEFSSLIDCGVTVRSTASRVTGITNEMLRGQPSPKAAYSKFKGFIGTMDLVAHNADFDRSFLRREFGMLGWGLPNKVHCSLKLSRRIIPELPNHRLETVARYLLGSERPSEMQKHRALDDARLTAKIWLSLANR